LIALKNRDKLEKNLAKFNGGKSSVLTKLREKVRKIRV